MPRDVNGNFVLVAGNPVAGGTPIEPSWANSTLEDIAVAMTDSLSRTGDGGMLSPFLNADGNEVTPGITWSLEPSSGFYRAGLQDQRASIGGNDTTRWIDASGEAAGEQKPFEIWDGVGWSAPFVIGAPLSLANDVFLTGRNAADNADIDIVKVSTANGIVFGAVGVSFNNDVSITGGLLLSGLAGVDNRNVAADENGLLVIDETVTGWDPEDGFPNGTLEAPSIKFTAGTGQGFYQDGLDTYWVGFQGGSEQRVKFQQSREAQNWRSLQVFNGNIWLDAGGGVIAKGSIFAAGGISGNVGIVSCINDSPGNYTVVLSQALVNTTKMVMHMNTTEFGTAIGTTTFVYTGTGFTVKTYQWNGTSSSWDEVNMPFDFTLSFTEE